MEKRVEQLLVQLNKNKAEVKLFRILFIVVRQIRKLHNYCSKHTPAEVGPLML